MRNFSDFRPRKRKKNRQINRIFTWACHRQRSKNHQKLPSQFKQFCYFSGIFRVDLPSRTLRNTRELPPTPDDLGPERSTESKCGRENSKEPVQETDIQQPFNDDNEIALTSDPDLLPGSYFFLHKNAFT